MGCQSSYYSNGYPNTPTSKHNSKLRAVPQEISGLMLNPDSPIKIAEYQYSFYQKAKKDFYRNLSLMGLFFNRTQDFPIKAFIISLKSKGNMIDFITKLPYLRVHSDSQLFFKYRAYVQSLALAQEDLNKATKFIESTLENTELRPQGIEVLVKRKREFEQRTSLLRAENALIKSTIDEIGFAEGKLSPVSCDSFTAP